MMDILSCQSRKSTGEINDINLGFASIYVSLFHSSGTVHARSLTWFAVTLKGMKSSLVTPVLVLEMSAMKPINIMEESTLCSYRENDFSCGAYAAMKSFRKIWHVRLKATAFWEKFWCTNMSRLKFLVYIRVLAHIDDHVKPQSFTDFSSAHQEYRKFKMTHEKDGCANFCTIVTLAEARDWAFWDALKNARDQTKQTQNRWLVKIK